VVRKPSYDFAVVGGGIVGLAAARALLAARPGASLVLLEKEDRLAAHQTGRNSGVIHSGIYYQPGSLKTELCRRGSAATRAFAAEHSIAVRTCGKLLVATSPAELARMAALEQRAAVNGITTQRLDAAELARREPNVTGCGALFVPATGVIDYALVAEALRADLAGAGATILTGRRVTGIVEAADRVLIDATARDGRPQDGSPLDGGGQDRGTWDATPRDATARNGGARDGAARDERLTAARLVVCAGLQADRLARLAGLRLDLAPLDIAIVPFRGEYYRLPPARDDLINHLVYPIPDPALPFLGVHLTRTPDGGVTVGPNAVLGLSREGYRKGSVNPRDAADCLRFPGLWRLARRNLRAGIREQANSLRKRGYLRECHKYCPSLTTADLTPHPTGIRAQAMRRDGTLIDDFLFAQTDRMLHVLNAPSPAATAALPIGGLIAARLLAADDDAWLRDQGFQLLPRRETVVRNADVNKLRDELLA